jgi:hypothetical protein
MVAGDRLGSFARALQRAGVDRIDLLALEPVGQGVSLLQTERREWRIRLALVAADTIPFALTMSNKN